MARYNYDEILLRLMNRLQDKTEVVDIDPGSIARTFSEVMAEEYSLFYDELDLSTTRGFISAASGKFLDLIGVLLNCIRTTGESDANFRVRITNQVYVLAGGNLIAIRLKALSVAGVRDIVTKEFTKGTGSFSIYVLTNEIETPQAIINQVQDIVNQTKSYGVYAEVKAPVLLPIDLKVRLVFGDVVSEAEKASIRQVAKQNIKAYIDSISMGGNFSINEALSSTTISSSKVVDREPLSMKINGIIQFAKNFSANWDERIVVGSLDII